MGQCSPPSTFTLYCLGNEVDQLFSILTKEFKTEIRCPQDLLQIIKSAPIKPKPVVGSLDYAFDWKGFIEPLLAGGTKALKNHTVFHSFKWSKEGDITRFRGKLLPQDPDSEFGPQHGIQLVTPGVDFSPVGPAELRIEKLELVPGGGVVRLV